MKVLVIIALVGVALFALAWWSSGRSKPWRSGRQQGDADQDMAYFEASVHRTRFGNDTSGFGGGL